LKGFEELVVFWFGPVLPRLGDSVGLADLLGCIFRGVGGGDGGCSSGRDGGEGRHPWESHASRIQVESLRRVRVFGYHSKILERERGERVKCWVCGETYGKFM